MSINIVSLPKEMTIPQHWLQTSKTYDKVHLNAQSFFKKWTDSHLKHTTTLLNIGKVVCMIGLGVSVYGLSIIGIVAGGLGLTVCLIGQQAIRRQQLLRCQEVCFNLEEWLVEIKKACENIQHSFSVYHHRQHLMMESYDEDMLQIINQIPANQFHDLVDLLEKHHQMVFGKWRKVGKYYQSSNWIQQHLKIDFGCTLNTFYAELQEFKDLAIESSFIGSTTTDFSNNIHFILKFFNQDEKVADPKDLSLQPVVIQNKELLSQDNNPHSNLHFQTLSLIDQIEDWRQNIALFRSSLL